MEKYSKEFEEVNKEAIRQDTLRDEPYTKDRDGVRLALAYMLDELNESLAEWSLEKKQKSNNWSKTKAELVQTLAVGIRLLKTLNS